METGITVPQDVVSQFRRMRDEDSQRWMKLLIRNETIVADGSGPKRGTLKSDMQAISELVDRRTACYFIVRTDAAESKNYLLIWYVPGGCGVRDKMLYSSTLRSVLRGFGDDVFVDNYHTTDVSELTSAGFTWLPKSERLSEMDEEFRRDFMTDEERMLQEEMSTSTGSAVFTASAGKSLAFPCNPDCMAAIRKFATGSGPHLVLIKIENETICLDSVHQSISNGAVGPVLPARSPRFGLYRFVHTFEGQQQDTGFFIYSCPSSSRVQEKMIASSTKGTVTQIVGEAGVRLSKSVEVSNPEELNQQFFMDEAHPKKYEPKHTFSRPKRPGRGRRRRPAKKPIL